MKAESNYVLMNSLSRAADAFCSLLLLLMSRCSEAAASVTNDDGSDASRREDEMSDKRVSHGIGDLGVAQGDSTVEGDGSLSPVRVVLTPRSSESGDPFVDVIVKACT